MFRPDFFQHCFQSRSGIPLFLYNFCDVRINVCVSVTFVYFILNPTVNLSSDKSSGLSQPFSLSFFMFSQAFFATCKNKGPQARLACVILNEKTLQSQIAFRACLRSHSARNSVDRSRTDLRPPPEAIQVGSIPDRSQKSANVHIQLVLRCERGLSYPWCSAGARESSAINSSSKTQERSVGPGEKARQKFSSKGGKAPGYRLSPDHFQTVTRMLAPD